MAITSQASKPQPDSSSLHLTLESSKWVFGHNVFFGVFVAKAFHAGIYIAM